ncbi:MAG: TonB system transport protein ExbD [Janthinobacterium lividum]
MSFRLDEGDEPSELHEINVTPFIDVMLVLMIVFMVAAPLATVDVGVDLPAATAQPQPRPDHPLTITLRLDGSVWLGADSIDPAALGPALDGASGGDRDQRVFLRADSHVEYERLIALMNTLRGAGYLKVGLVGLDASPTR